MQDDLNFWKMEDNLNFRKMEDDLFFCKRKKTSFSNLMETNPSYSNSLNVK